MNLTIQNNATVRFGKFVIVDEKFSNIFNNLFILSSKSIILGVINKRIVIDIGQYEECVKRFYAIKKAYKE